MTKQGVDLGVAAQQRVVELVSQRVEGQCRRAEGDRRLSMRFVTADRQMVRRLASPGR